MATDRPTIAQAPKDGASAARLGTFSSLRIRDFRLLWLAQLSNGGALWMEIIARPVLVYAITGSAAQVGAVVAIGAIPQLLFGIVAGVLADWFDRRRVLLAAYGSSLLLTAVFVTLLVTDRLELWHIYVAVFLAGVISAIEHPARQSLMPSLVGAERVTNALGLLAATQSTMRIMGTASVGFVLAVVGMDAAYVVIGAMYASATLWTALIHTGEQRRPEAAGLLAMGRGLVEGAHYAARQPAIRGLLTLTVVYFTFGWSYVQVFAPLFALDVLEIGEFGLGLMMAATGVGSIFAALVVARTSPQRLGLVLPWVTIAFGTLLLSFSLLSYLPASLGRGWVILPLLLAPPLGMVQTSFFSLSQALMLDSAPEQLRGRVLSLLALGRAMAMLGAALGGVAAELLGTQPAQIAFGSIVALGATVIMVLMPGFRRATLGSPSATAEAAAETGAAAEAGAEHVRGGATAPAREAAAASAASSGGQPATQRAEQLLPDARRKSTDF